MDYEDYGYFIDIDIDSYSRQSKQLIEKRKDIIYPKKITEYKMENKYVIEEKFTNYESFKKNVFSINIICCFTVTILFLNVWVFPKKL